MPDRDERARRPGQAAHRQPHRHQQPPGPLPRRQGRASRTSSATPWSRPWRVMPEMNNGFTEKDGKPGPRRSRPTSTSASPSTSQKHDGTRQLVVPSIKSAEDDGLRPLLDRLRGHRPQGPRQQADRRGLPGHDDLADQPRRHRHRALGAAPDAGPGHDHRRRRPRLPRRVAGREPRDAQPQRRQQDPHAHLHLRPPDHPGRPVRRLPADHPPAAARRATASTTRSSSRCASPTSRSAGSRTSTPRTTTTSTRSPACRSSSTPTACAAT